MHVFLPDGSELAALCACAFSPTVKVEDAVHVYRPLQCMSTVPACFTLIARETGLLLRDTTQAPECFIPVAAERSRARVHRRGS